MPESITINLETLTPLWTGGVDATSEVARATGIAGSPRWWYEAIQRVCGHRSAPTVAIRRSRHSGRTYWNERLGYAGPPRGACL
jgi:CRISPR-associated protein Cmr1